VSARLVLAALALATLPGRAAASDLLADAAEADAGIEERVRLVLAHRLAGDAEALASDVDDLQARDDARRDAGLPRTGLTDDVRYIAAGVVATRDAQRDALHAVLREHPDPVVRRLAEHRLENDDAEAADHLLAADRHNRRAAVLNDAVRPLGIFSGGVLLAALNPFLLAGSAADSAITTAVNLWHYNRLSTPEREALARYTTGLERDPQTRDAPEIVRAMQRIGTKRAETLCEDTLDLADKALDDHDLDHAAFYAHSADRIDGCADRAARPIEKVTEARAQWAAREEAGRWSVDDPPQPRSDEEWHDREAVLVATALADPGRMIEAASRFRERHEDSPFAPGALYALAVGRHLGGHADAGREALEELAHDHRSGAGRHAAAVLASADYSGLDAIRVAERQHVRDTTRYVLLGGRLDGRTALYTATRFGAEGLRAAQSFGIFNVIGVMTRAWHAWRKDPVSNQAIIDRGEEFLAREPDPAEAADVHRRLTDAYERAGLYDRALMHLRATPDPSEKRIEKLEGKLADALLERAEQNGGNATLLSGIVRHFGATDAAEKARKKLKDRPADDELVLDRDVLVAYPSLLATLDLDPKLLDGARDNGEIADGGITLTPGQMRLTLYNVGEAGQHIETRSLDSAAWERARATAQEALYRRTLTAERRDPDSGRFERYIPFYLQGSIDDGGGISVYPGVKMRRYESEDPQLYQ
jgi:tetratricopeptide (TPR) repeat protein